jgi:hypothetical protein
VLRYMFHTTVALTMQTDSTSKLGMILIQGMHSL